MKQTAGAVVMIGLLTLTGFDYSRHSIPLDEIRAGGPPKDGIPALYDPGFIPAGKADYLRASDRVLGLAIGGEAKAYPVRILNWHELVNDRMGGKSVLVTYCPLCGTGMAFDADIDGERFLFGVSGRLYNSNVLFYDKTTESLWSQLKQEAVTGPMTGQELTLLPLEHTTWQAWSLKHPNTLVLSTDTGHFRNYQRDPYVGYDTSAEIYFPVSHRDSRLSTKAWVAGVVVQGQAKAYPLSRLEADKDIHDTIAGKDITVTYNQDSESVMVRDKRGQVIPSVQAYWFAWSAFYPETKMYKEN